MDFFKKIRKSFSSKTSKRNELEINQNQKSKCFLNSVQSLSEFQRKIILWIIVIIISLILLIFWFKNVQRILVNFSIQEIKKNFQTPFQEKLKEIEIPNIETPQISEEELNKLKEKIEKEEIEQLEK